MNIQEAKDLESSLKKLIDEHNAKIFDVIENCEYAKNYVRAYQDALKRINKSKSVGISKGELKRYSRLLVKLTESDIDNILAELVSSGLVETTSIPTQSGRGRPKVSYMAVNDD